jgi:2-C-methyl-D-erythritol 2,4-cyclodiphosphate synthase
MAIRFDAGARRSILAATIEAEKHGRSRPLPTDLLMGLLSLPESPVPAAIAGPGADARALIATAMAAVAAEGGRRPQSPQDAEIILQRAADLAAHRGAEEVGILDILSAALHGADGAAAEILAAARESADRLHPPRTSLDGGPRSEPAPRQPAARVGYTRAGIGYDSHRFGDSGPLVLGGVRIAESVRLLGHSDGDAIAHAVTDAVLGAAGAGDIGEMFADTDPANRDRDSLEMLGAAVARIRVMGLVVHQVDVTVIAERPKIAPHREAMRVALAAALGTAPAQVSVKGKTNEGMGWIGRGEGIACVAVATLVESSAP